LEKIVSYLSVVFVGSNAGYGGDFLGRVQNCIDNLYCLAEKHGLDADLTFVEWNPPADRPRMEKAIDWSRSTIPTRIITVPKEIHDSLPNPHGEKFFEYIAKNVGIRRAIGKFVLSSNPDNIYSDELIKRLAQRDLSEDCFYRVNRSDTRDGKVFQINYPDGTVIDGKRQDNPNSVRVDASGFVNYDEFGYIPPLHFNAAGDFILMSREAWADIKGHPEVPYSLTVDGHTVYLAAKTGRNQIVLSEPMYHADHSRTPKYCPHWNDLTPYGTRNKTWGFEGIEFDTRSI
jgi:hypothetical protein